MTAADPKKIAALAGQELSPNPSPMAAAIKPPARADKNQESLKPFVPNGNCSSSLSVIAHSIYNPHAGYSYATGLGRSDDEIDNPNLADERNYYKVEKWTRDGMKVDRPLYAGDKALKLFAEAIKHHPRIRLTIRQRTRACCSSDQLEARWESSV